MFFLQTDFKYDRYLKMQKHRKGHKNTIAAFRIFPFPAFYTAQKVVKNGAMDFKNIYEISHKKTVRTQDFQYSSRQNISLIFQSPWDYNNYWRPCSHLTFLFWNL